ncbi:hypothetical protein Tco_0375664 [Tanacetum coccineum]
MYYVLIHRKTPIHHPKLVRTTVKIELQLQVEPIRLSFVLCILFAFLLVALQHQVAHTCVKQGSPQTQNPVRIIPGPAGIVQAAKLLKQKDILLGLDGAVMSTQEYMKKVVKDVGDIKNSSKNEKLDQVIAIVKSYSPNVIGDLTVTMKDLSGTIPGTIHHKVIGEGGYGKDITVSIRIRFLEVAVVNALP